MQYQEPIPDVTFVNNAALFSDAQIQLLEHIEGAGEVSAYWECSVVGHDDLIVIPDRHIRDIEIPAALEGEQEMTIQMEMAGRYILSVVDLSHARVIQGTTVKIPEDELAALLAEQGVSGSSSLMVSVDEGVDLDELQDEIGRWMPGVSIQAGNEQALQQQEFMLMLQQSLPLISALIFALSFGVSVMIKLMRAKEEQKRDELLWLYGLGQRERTRLSIVENARKAGLALCSSLLITAGILAAVSALDLWNIGKAMIISLGYLLVMEAAAELLRVLVVRHKRS